MMLQTSLSSQKLLLSCRTGETIEMPSINFTWDEWSEIFSSFCKKHGFQEALLQGVKLAISLRSSLYVSYAMEALDVMGLQQGWMQKNAEAYATQRLLDWLYSVDFFYSMAR